MSQNHEEQGDLIASHYASGLSGWAGKAKAQKAWEEIKGSPEFVPLDIKNVQGDGRLMLFDVVKKVLGKFTENYPQEIGDCVSFGAKNAVEYLQCCEILMKGDREKFHNVFPPYFYGISRVQIGGGRIGCNSDGSVGSWAAQGVVKYGVLRSDFDGVPKYSGSIARKWGCNGAPDMFIQEAKSFPVQSAAIVTNWDDFVKAITNGFPVTIASNVGFEMKVRNGEFYHRASGVWNHQMMGCGVSNTSEFTGAIILNNWGDVHGRLKDEVTGEELPPGVLRVKKDVVEKMLRQGDSFAFSNFKGFPEQPVDKELFKLI